MVLPSTVSVENIYGSIMKAKFSAKSGAKASVVALSKLLTGVTSDVWDKVKKSLLPTPSRFHYLFNMRELSRVFQGIMECPVDCLKDDSALAALWKHETTRVFADKLSRQQDKDFVDKCIDEFLPVHFGEELAEKNKKLFYYCDFQK